MTFDIGQFSGECACGETHKLATREIIIESGAISGFAGLADRLELGDGAVVVCDDNTRFCAERIAEILGRRMHRTRLACLSAKDLHADEHAVALLDGMLPPDAGWLVAAGDGTIHDTTRFVAKERGTPFVAFPTAAAVDAYVSATSAMTWHGYKVTAPAAAPVAVVADTDIFSSAPYRLTASGLGEALGKYTSLADWKVASLVTGEPYCERIASRIGEAADAVRAEMPDIRRGGRDGCERLMYTLLLSGTAMQLCGSSRPASGAEHHLSHLWELEVINPRLGALHGEKVGIGAIIVLERYKDLLKSGALASDRASPVYGGLPTRLLRAKFGDHYGNIVAENTPDPLESVSPDALLAALPEIREIVAGLPDPAALAKQMEDAGCKTTLREIGLGDGILRDSLELSPFVRARLTLQRLSSMLPPRGAAL
ncbi:MAG: iron-containing alcohol dehydrogenase [Oscillospiraceae bacterium]|nr:iron-containing alcohol dehydrogenase [Oscillospiraceae bacterium]